MKTSAHYLPTHSAMSALLSGRPQVSGVSAYAAIRWMDSKATDLKTPASIHYRATETSR